MSMLSDANRRLFTAPPREVEGLHFAADGPPPVREPLAVLLARAAAPSASQQAIKEAIISMASDATAAGAQARAECDRLDDTLRVLQDHLYRALDDYEQRIHMVAAMYRRHEEQAVMAQRALYAMQLTPPAPPPGLIAEQTIAADQEATSIGGDHADDPSH